MSIQYSGGPNVNTTMASPLGTRRELVDFLVVALQAAGWTIISGGGSGDVLLATPMTPQGLTIRCRIYDPGSGNCARVQMRNTTGLKVSSDHFLYPQVGKTWRCIADPYQWFAVVPGSTLAREFACMGVPWIPSFLSITGDCGWIHSNSYNDAGTARVSFRTFLCASCGSHWDALCNDNLIGTNEAQMRYADLTLITPSQAIVGDLFCAYMWHDDSQFLSEPLIAWGLVNLADWARIRGQLWDAAVVSGTFAGDLPFTFNGHNWYSITHNNAGLTGAYHYKRGTLLVVVP